MNDKKCPVDRGKLLIGLECCRSCGGNECRECPYDFCAHLNCTMRMAEDALAYIGWLEEQAEELALHVGMQFVDGLRVNTASQTFDGWIRAYTRACVRIEEAICNAGNDHEGRQDPDDA